jgi:flagellar biogenesis protein FliO
MGAVIATGIVIILGFVLFSLYAILKMSSEQSRIEESYRIKSQRRKHDSNEPTKKTKSK